MRNMKTLTFSTGIPTAPDIKRLHDQFGVPKDGQLITYESTAECIGSAVMSLRWRTVTTAWRKQVYREHNVFMRAEPKQGFVAATSGERVHIAGSGLKGAMRKVLRVGDIALRTEKKDLDEDEVRACDHVIRASASIRLAAATAAKQMRLPDSTNGK